MCIAAKLKQLAKITSNLKILCFCPDFAKLQKVLALKKLATQNFS
jgi:hypothetical protein